MAKKSAVEKNEHRRRLVEQYAAKRAGAEDDRAWIASAIPRSGSRRRCKLAELPRNGAKVRIRNRCLLTGRPRAYYRKFGLSRIALRDLASQGQIPGVVKSSW